MDVKQNKFDWNLKLKSLNESSRKLAQVSAEKKSQLLIALSRKLKSNESMILSANQLDLEELDKNSTSAFRDRLTLTPARIQSMIESLEQVAQAPDPVGEEIEKKTLPNGLILRKVRAPLGLIFMIFESRPNVITEAFSLAFKSGNSILLRGGKESKHTARIIYKFIEELTADLGLDVFYGIDDYDRNLVSQLLQRNDLIDVTVPRGGDGLIQFVTQTAKMPIIKNDRGMCHVYIDSEADLQMALRIVVNSKTHRPGVCNAMETLLVHRSIAKLFLPLLNSEMQKFKLRWHVDQECFDILKPVNPTVELAQTKDWDTEYLDLIMNCAIVDSTEKAIEHISIHGSKHSEAIVTNNQNTARYFQNSIDAAATYWNASTRFTDGFQFGLGGELGISTQKLHVRGPVGLKELTSIRWLIDGTGQIRI